MKNVRVWFEKKDQCIYISHLDLNRCMIRAIQKSRIPIWHTEGFNPHPFITFPMPLSLGFVGKKECMDMRLLEDDFSFKEIIDRLNNCLPKGIRVYNVTEPKMKAGVIDKALYVLKLTCDGITPDELLEKTEELFSRDEIMVDKKSKSGIKQVNLKEYLSDYTVSVVDDYVKIKIMLPAGSTLNVNPTLLVDALEKEYNIEIFPRVTRLNIFNKDGEEFA